MRKEGVTEPILIPTLKDTPEDTVSGFAGGADDYLKKPFAFEELLARISALLRRPPLVAQDSVYITPDVRVEISARRIFKEGVEVHLTAKEFSILVYFIRHQKTPINQQALYDHVFDFAEVQLSNTVEVHIKNIRKNYEQKNMKYHFPLFAAPGTASKPSNVTHP